MNSGATTHPDPFRNLNEQQSAKQDPVGLRAIFAGYALQGMLANVNTCKLPPNELADKAVEYADLLHKKFRI
jgi:hypothetical protein